MKIYGRFYSSLMFGSLPILLTLHKQDLLCEHDVQICQWSAIFFALRTGFSLALFCGLAVNKIMNA